MPSITTLLSLFFVTYRKTGSSTLIDDLHKFGHGISYTETEFAEDKQGERLERIHPQHSSFITTLVYGRRDQKSKGLKGKETNITNS